MSAFEDFIKIELPLRQVLVTDSFNPSVSGVPALRGTYFLDSSDNYTRYEKTGSANTAWTPVGGAQESDLTSLRSDVATLSARADTTSRQTKTLLSTDSGSLTATMIDCFDILQTKAVKYTIHVENSTSFCTFEMLVSYHNTSNHGTGVKHVAYAAVGQNDLTSIETVHSGSKVHVKLTPTQANLIVYCTATPVLVSPYSNVEC